MKKSKFILFSGIVMFFATFGLASAAILSGNVSFNADNSDSVGYTGAENISVISGGSLIVSAATGGIISVNDTLYVEGDFFHNGSPTTIGDPNFYGQGSLSFTGDNAAVVADKLKVDGDFSNGDGIGGWNIELDINKIEVGGTLIAEENSKIVINSDYSGTPSLSAGDIYINGGLYMGTDVSSSNDIMCIASVSDDDVYTIVSSTGFNLDGSINAETGKIAIQADDAKISEDIFGSVNFDVGSLSLGGATLAVDPDWRQRMQRVDDGQGGYVGDLLADGTILSDDDILIGGSVDGNLDITGNSDMWIGEDLLGYWSISVNNLYVMGDINGDGDISADVINVGGDLSGNINIDANEIFVYKDVLGDTKFRPNLPNGTGNGFHVNPDTGNSGPFKQIDVTVNGTYYFNDDSYLQLVLNSSIAASGGTSGYEADMDDALMKVGGFDASAVTQIPNLDDMDSTPNIEILVDNLSETIRKIKLIDITDPSGVIDLGLLNMVGVWFYWDDDADGINDRRLFQESRLVLENNSIYTIIATMDSITRLTAASQSASDNDVEVARAVDDLIISRLHNYSGYTDDNLDNYYTAVMRILFPNDDTYNTLMINGGSYKDALDVMVSQSPDYALDFVRGIGVGNFSDMGAWLSLSSHVSRNAVSDQLIEDFVWKRYYNKNIGWLRIGFGDNITSFNFGADTKFKKFIAGINIGYNIFDFGAMSGDTTNIGLYITYRLNDIARVYASANLALHSAEVKNENQIVGDLSAKFSTADTTLDLGLIHKIFDNYITGRGYMTLGMQGGYEFTQHNSKNQDFMDIRVDSQFILLPGYELSLGKDIWFGVGSFMRPSIKFGLEYDVLNSFERDLSFKFSEVDIWRKWIVSNDNQLWMRMGGQLDFSFIIGTNLSIGYEVLKNGDFKSKQIKLNGTYRF